MPVNSVGLYSFGYSIARIIEGLLVTPFADGFTPTIRKLEADPMEQKKFVRISATYTYLIGMFMALGISVFSREAVMLLARREEFWESWVVVPIIAFAYVHHALAIFTGCGMAMKNKPYHISGILIASALLNIALNFALIPFLGLIGVAMATLISYVVWNILKMYYSAKFYELHFDLKRLTHIAIIGIGLYLLSLSLASGATLWLNLAIKILLLIAFPVLFLATRFFSDAERREMKKFLAGLWKTTLSP